MSLSSITEAMAEPSDGQSRFRRPPRYAIRDSIVQALLWGFSVFVVLATLTMLLFIARVGIKGIGTIGIVPLVTGTIWKPESAIFGGLPLIFGTLASAMGAVLVGALPAVLASLWVTELAPRSSRPVFRRIMEIASSIPSVVFGWMALVHLVPSVEKVAHFLHGNLPVTGEGLASSGLLLGVMIAPTVFLLSLDALERAPSSLREASAALGASPWQTAFRVSMPHAWRGLLIAVFFGFARAAGETMAVQMVIGGARKMPLNAFSPTTTISTQIVMDMQNARPDTLESNVLFSMSLILLVISVAMVLATRFLSRGAPR